MFNIGELKEVLEIHKEVKVADKNTGMSNIELQKLYRLRCKKKVQSYKEYINANRETESQIIKFLIFSRRDIYLDNIVLYKNDFITKSPKYAECQDSSAQLKSSKSIPAELASRRILLT